jgi:hypothetical protein
VNNRPRLTVNSFLTAITILVLAGVAKGQIDRIALMEPATLQGN